jgi:hypothetical protein
MKTRTWEHKVDAVIGRLSRAAWYQANHDKQGNRYKRHHPYRIPSEAEALVTCLGMRDRRAAEISAKEIMMGLRQAQVSID